MKLKNFKVKYRREAKLFIKDWEETLEHNTDFAIAFKDDSYRLWKELIKDLTNLR